MVLLAVRISRSYDDLKGMWEALREECTAMIVYQHDADEETSRTHVHAVLQDLSIGVETIKYRVKSYLKTKVFCKSDWCFQTEVGRPKSAVTWDYITYMSKGTLEPVLIHNVTDNDIALKTSNWIPEGKGHKLYKTIRDETPEQKRKRQIDLVKEVVAHIEQVKEQGQKYGPSLEEHVVMALQATILKHDLVVGRYKLRDYYDAVMMRVNPIGYRERIMGLVAFREKNNLYTT